MKFDYISHTLKTQFSLQENGEEKLLHVKSRNLMIEQPILIFMILLLNGEISIYSRGCPIYVLVSLFCRTINLEMKVDN